ncbi:hypothetical protein [Halorussus sp. AFM4]|uniref:hypothetical protein n=1 Tax=Halorussus sp. AFM4 TaxID=3421651 RepID=UPI003EBDE553
MTPTTVALLHGAGGSELALLEYLSRVALHLLAFGGVAVVALRGPDAVRGVRAAVAEIHSGVAERRDDRENDP